jgi:transcriptional regulator with XRE-family HTH domain
MLRTLGTTLRHYRKQQGLSQQALATKAGLHYTYVSEIELGQRNVSVLSLFRLATALQLPVSALLVPLEVHQDTSTGVQK